MYKNVFDAFLNNRLRASLHKIKNTSDNFSCLRDIHF